MIPIKIGQDKLVTIEMMLMKYWSLSERVRYWHVPSFVLTIVVSFDMEVAPDLIHTGKTGCRAELKNSVDLARGILYMLDHTTEEYRRMSEACRRIGIQLCHPTVQMESFINRFNSLLCN